MENEDMVMVPANSSIARLEHAWPLDGEEPLALRRIDAAEMFRGVEGNSGAGLTGSGGFAVFGLRFEVDDRSGELG